MNTPTSLLLSFIILVSPFLRGDLVDHLKKITEKSDIHRIDNIDFIYMINLDERPEKYQKSLEILSPYNIIPYRFSAVNGWKLNISTLNDVGVRYNGRTPFHQKATFFSKIGKDKIIPVEDAVKLSGNYFAKGVRASHVGIVLSHLSVLQDALDSGYEIIWVMEDDIMVNQDPRILSYLIDQLTSIDEQWDILYTDSETTNPEGVEVRVHSSCPRPNFKIKPTEYYCYRKKINKNFTLKRARFGAYSMILRRSGIKKILDFFKKYNIFAPYDIDCFYAENLRIYTCNEKIVSHRINALSDNDSPGYIK